MENQKTKIISIVALVALALTVITATYAYFQAQTGEGSQTDIRINANTVDTFTFETGNVISIDLDQTSFASGAGNKVGSTYASAKLTANNKTNSATNNYNLYLNISDNNFSYTQSTSYPEILLTIKDASNNEITSVPGLEYKTVTDGKGASISGFDITTKTGLITLLSNREITTTSTKTDTWNITATFVNYNADQSKNAGKNLTGKVEIQKNNPVSLTLAEYIINQYKNGERSNIYFHSSSLDGSANDDSYRYAGSSTSVKNYICLENTLDTCSDDNLYRIIGVFDNKTKLIKATSYGNGTVKWDSAGGNNWGTSSLKEELNSSFLTSYLSNIDTKILETEWYVGSISSANITPQECYLKEIQSTYKYAKVGLMNVNDYMYAATPTWDLTGRFYEETKDYNWMYTGNTEWTLSLSTNGNYGISIASTGNIDDASAILSLKFAIARPVFYLGPSVEYLSGDGTQNSPIRLKI